MLQDVREGDSMKRKNRKTRDQKRFGQCQRKIRYTRWIDAKESLERIRAREREVDSLHVYACRFCGGFHLGHH